MVEIPQGVGAKWTQPFGRADADPARPNVETFAIKTGNNFALSDKEDLSLADPLRGK
jgi:hypothetical protein